MTIRLFFRTVLAVWLSLSLGHMTLAPAFGQGLHDSAPTLGLNDITSGRLLFKTATPGRFIPAPTLHTDVSIAITGLIARTTVTQTFTNPSHNLEDWAEGLYVFPLPETAAVDHLRMTVGERIIEGQIKERVEAKQVYEQAKRAGQRASLVEQERPNIFTTSVANIAPGDHITVTIEYQETVRYDQGLFSLRFPMVVGPRYIPGTPVIVDDQPAVGAGWAPETDRVPDAARITPPVQHPSDGPINPVNLTVDLVAGFPVRLLESPSHDILTVSAPDGRQQITLRAETVPADRDFVLRWRPAGGQAPTVAAFHEQQGDDHYLLLMAMPPISDTEPADRVPREAIFVIDTSGSMAGTSIEQARAALLLALTRLTSQDRFNVIEFNSVTHRLFTEAQPVTPATLRKAVRFVERLQANGGTDILPALTMALHAPAHPTALRQIIFLTDGQVGNENELFDTIRTKLGDSRLFTIGIGSAPNSYFMRTAAEYGRGTFTHIGSTSEVKDQMDAIFRKLEHPALTDLHLEGLSGEAEPFPARIPDLYAGEPLVVAVKTRSVPEQLTLLGQIGSTAWSATLPLGQREPREGLSVYWARQKIAHLMDQERAGQSAAEIKRAIIDVALTHHLVSPYTSLVAVDVTPVRPSAQALHQHAMKTNLPDGQHYDAIFGLPKTATAGPVHLLLGLSLVLLTGLAWRLRGRLA